MKYKYELHCHTAGVSQCASIKPKELVNHYEKLGYDGIVLTDHFFCVFFHFLFVVLLITNMIRITK